MLRFKIKIRYVIIVVLGMIIYTVVLTGASRAVFREPNNGKELVGPLISNIIYESSEIPKNIRLFFRKPQFLIPNNIQKDGFTYHSKDTDQYPKLLISFKNKTFNSKIQLLDIKTDHLIKEWAPNSKLISKLSYNQANPRGNKKGSDLNFSHPLLLKDSSIVVNTGYSLVKINTNSEVEWVNNTIASHHSIELDAVGDIYTPGTSFKSGHYDFLPENSKVNQENLLDDLVLKIDAATGQILYSKSVIEILQENGYHPLIYDKGYLIHDPIHLNDVQPALKDGDYWKKDDLLLSCRNLSTVFLYRPSTNKIIWSQQGPWSAQHDPNFYNGNKVIVFGNDVLFDYSKSIVLKERFHSLNGNNEIYIYNFENDSITTPFSRLLRNEKIKTPSQGRCDILSNGDLFVEETDYGRIIIGDSIHKKVEFVRRIDPDHITILNWSRIIQ